MLFKFLIGWYVDKWNFGGFIDFGGGWMVCVMFRRLVGEVIICISDYKKYKKDWWYGRRDVFVWMWE